MRELQVDGISRDPSQGPTIPRTDTRDLLAVAGAKDSDDVVGIRSRADRAAQTVDVWVSSSQTCWDVSSSPCTEERRTRTFL